jgi:hypothetical protein
MSALGGERRDAQKQRGEPMEFRVRLLKWWQPPSGSISSKTTGWYDEGSFTPSMDLTFAQQIGQDRGEGRYLLLAESDPGWWREIKVEAVETHYREACEDHRASQPQAERATKEASDGR